MLASALALLMLGATGQPASAAPGPVVINLLPPPCPEKPSDADVLVCARPTPDYRIDPGILAAERSRQSAPMSEKQRVRNVAATSCHDLPTKCQGSGVIPVLPVVLKSVQAAILAVKGEEWRDAFRTQSGDYEAYKAEKARRRVRVGVSASGEK